MTSDFMDIEMDCQKSWTSSQDVMTEFIDIYRENPCLWKLSHPDRKNRHAKHSALLKLLACIKKEEPRANMDRVKLKINSIRTSFKREVRKVELSKMGEGKVYSPKLWYYGMLWFILEAEEENTQILKQLQARKDGGGETRSRGDDSIPSTSSDANRYGSSRVNNEVTTSESGKSDRSNMFPPSRMRSPPSNHINTRTRRKNSDKSDKSRLIRNKLFKSSVKKPDDDEFDFIGRVVATKLRNLPDTMRIIAEKLIHEVLCQAQLDRITDCSNIVTFDAGSV